MTSPRLNHTFFPLCTALLISLTSSAEAREPTTLNVPEEPEQIDAPEEPEQLDDEGSHADSSAGHQQFNLTPSNAMIGRFPESLLQTGAGVAVGGVGALTLGAAGLFIGLVTWDEDKIVAFTLGGTAVGLIGGASMAAYGIGHVLGSNGSLLVSIIGSTLGVGAGVLTSTAVAKNPLALGIGLGAGLGIAGAVVGYQISDRRPRGAFNISSINVSPTQGGASMQLGITF